MPCCIRSPVVLSTIERKPAHMVVVALVFSVIYEKSVIHPVVSEIHTATLSPPHERFRIADIPRRSTVCSDINLRAW